MFKLQIKTGGLAFDDDDNFEVVRILKRVADEVENGRTYGSVMDINGNKVGSWELDKEGRE